MTDAERLAETFKLFSTEARIRILQHLKRGATTVVKLTTGLGITQSATSQHLRILRDAHLVTHYKSGTNVYYNLDKQNIKRTYKAVSNLFS